MATYVPAKKGVAWIGYASLVSQANPLTLKSSPTLATGDFKVSIDGGALANLTTLPTNTPASSVMVKFSLSTSEMNGDNITVVCIDASGAEWCDMVFNVQTAARQIDDLAYPATSGRSMVVDASGLVDANTVKVGATGAGTAQTARDLGASVLLSTGTGTGQLDFTSGVVKANATQWLGGTIPAVNVTGVPLVDTKYLLGTIFSTPATAGIMDVNVKNIDNDAASASGTVTFPNATLASTTNITAGTITTVTNLTNAATSGDLTATMKTSVTTAATAATPTVVLSAGDSPVLQSGTAAAGASTTITIASAIGADARPVGCLIKITSGTGSGQARTITTYVNSTKVVTVDRAWATTPDNTSVYSILYAESPNVDASLRVDVGAVGGTAQTARDLGASVLLSTGTGTGQLDFTSGVVKANATQWLGGTIPAVNVTGVPLVDTKYLLGTIFSTPATAGIMDVNVKNIDNDAASASGTVTFPNATLASTTNITAGTMTTVTTATNVTTVNGLAANVVTAAAIADGAIDRATLAADTGLQSIRSNTAAAGAATSITLDASASAVTDFYKNTLIFLTGGTGVGQSRFITAYNGSTKVATVTAWNTNPDNTTTFAIRADDEVPGATAPTAAANATAVWTSLLAGSDFSTSSSIGKLLKDDVDATVSSRGSQSDLTLVKTKTDFLPSATAGASGGVFIAGTNAATSVSLTGNITGNLSGSVGSLTLNTDKTGYSLSTNDSDIVDNGTAQAGAASAITLRSGASATDSLYVGERVYITSGTGISQSRIITAYVGSTKVATVDAAWATAPDNTSTYVIKNSRTAKLDTSLQVTSASVQGNVTGSLGSLDTQAKADVLTQVNAALDAAITEISGDPGATPSLRQAAELLYMALRNKFTNNASTQAIYNSAGASILTNTISDDGTTYTKGKFS